MMELTLYLLHPVLFYGLALVVVAQLGWQAYRMLTAQPTLLRFNAFALIALTLAATSALWRPFDYQSLTNYMLLTALILPFAISAIISEKRWFKLLSIGHVVFACSFFYVLIQAAR